MPQMRALGKYGGEIQIGGLVLGTWLQSRPSRESLRRWSSTPLLSQRLSLGAIKPRCTTGMERRITRWEHAHVLEKIFSPDDQSPHCKREETAIVKRA